MPKTNDDDQMTVSRVKVFASFAGTVIMLCAGFYGGIEIAKAHADRKVEELKHEQEESLDRLSMTLKSVDTRVWTQGQDIAVIRTIVEERFGVKREK